MQEIWKDVKGLESYAEVSNLGRVRTKDRYINNNGTKVLMKGRIRNGYDNGVGYIQYSFTINGETIRKYGHVMVLESFTDKPSDKHEVDHIDNNKKNNNLSNLQWVTRKENMNKMFEFYDKFKKDVFCECGNKMDKSANKCIKCHGFSIRKTERPSKEELYKLILKYSFTEIGEMYGVKDNSIRKWCKSYDLPYRRKDIGNKIKKRVNEDVSHRKGSEVHNSKLDEYKVLEIKEKLKNGISQRNIAKEYKVSRGCIQNIKEGKTWNHIL